MEIKEMVGQIKRKTDAEGGLRMVYFVACGGSQAAIYPGKYLLQCEAKTMGAAIMNSDEFVHTPPAPVGPQSIVVVCSLKATPESVEAVKTANRLGAVTIAMTGSLETEMAQNGQYVIVYSNGDNQIYSQSNQSCVLRLGFELLKQYENYAYYSQAMAAYEKIDGIVATGKKSFKEKMENFASQYKDDKVFYVLGSGPCYSTAYTMACCHLMEMQARHCVYLHSGEYFQGPFETTDDTLPVILIKSIGNTRPVDERAERFLQKYAARHMVIDCADLGLNEIDAHVAEYFCSAVMIPIERSFVYELSLVRHHDMDFRRYMWKFKY